MIIVAVYNFKDSKYDRYRKKIYEQLEIGNSWKSIKELHNYREFISDESKIFNFFALDIGADYIINTQEWHKLVDYIKESQKGIQHVMISNNSKNNAVLSSAPESQWQRYLKKLENKFSKRSISNLKTSTLEILRQLSTSTVDSRPIKGLVVGNVQSGKTSNMIGLMSAAADHGFNYFIVLSGVIDNLRQQTENRMYDVLNQGDNLHWFSISNPSLKDRDRKTSWENIDVSSNSKKRYLTVCLKNKTRLKNLADWLYSDQHKAKQLKILIIDDEADQASINTKDIEGEDQTAINEQIKKLVFGHKGKKLQGVNYISYTATPYANVLNESGEYSLYPSDFIYSLTPAEDYIGPQEIFGTEEPETRPKVDIIRSITDTDLDQINHIHNNNAISVPRSLEDAVNWFLLTAAMVRINGRVKPISMLVHTSMKIDHHENLHEAIRNYLEEQKNDKYKFLDKLQKLYEEEKEELTKEHFIEAIPEYSKPSREINDYPEWKLIKEEIEKIFDLPNEDYVSHINLDEEGTPIYHNGIHIVIDNSRTKVDDQEVRLVYPEPHASIQTAPIFIVIGGNTLSRGLTIEGLSTTYFLRTTSQADTLMQMGRWFGYRYGYELYPRIWLHYKAKDRFTFLSQMDAELREELRTCIDPAHMGVRIKTHPDLKMIRITANNKMQSAQGEEYDFAGLSKQTTLFTNDKELLTENIQLTEDLLNSLSNVEKRQRSLIWRGVSYDQIKEYLSQFNFCDNDKFFSNLSLFFEWYEKVIRENGASFDDWNVVLSSIGDNMEKTDTWEIAGTYPDTVQRTRKGPIHGDGKTVSIGVLRKPTDLYEDIPLDKLEQYKEDEGIKKLSAQVSEIKKARKKLGYEDTPQLLLYRIDKDSTTTSKGREPLEFDEDIIGISLLLPGSRSRNNLATHISIKIKSTEYDEPEINEE